MSAARDTSEAVWTVSEIDDLVHRARQAGIDTGRVDERARVARLRDACFTGLVLTDDVRAALTRFDGMLLRGEDVPS